LVTPINWEDKYAGVFVLSAKLLKEEKHKERAHKIAKAILQNDRHQVDFISIQAFQDGNQIDMPPK